jgi:hypothetical protein
MKILLNSAAVVGTFLLTQSAVAGDWPVWRGPKGDGITPERFPDALPVDGLNRRQCVGRPLVHDG